MAYEMMRAPIVGDVFADIHGTRHSIAQITDLWMVPLYGAWTGTINDMAITLKYDRVGNFDLVHWKEIELP